MFHTFDTEVAELFHDANIATLFQNLCYWIMHNRTNDKNKKEIEINGILESRYFTFNSISAFLKQFPYYSKKQIETYLSKLKDKGLIAKANYNEKGFDRTSWYCLIDEEYWMQKYLGAGYTSKKETPLPSSPDCNDYTSSDNSEIQAEEVILSVEQENLEKNISLEAEESLIKNLQYSHFSKTGNAFPQTEKWISPKREMDFPKRGNQYQI